ncbi:DUF1838 family protein [Alteromonas sp. C1M14]|uniref:DUF1838 family protein n=1 Tax=Alteromonas sp. C1M14 TaxID=2841567 RepID=UPI001C09A034|nr:DUF1838 family protein [Alteromonas sp. C1M14]MBU2980028.1 DUF1838 domain-containing protein [Alteromonas sp. C1M14]
MKEKRTNDNPVLTEQNSRRKFLQHAALTIGGGALGLSAGQAIAMNMGGYGGNITSSNPDYKSLDFHNNYWARDAMARIQGDLEFGKQKFGWYKGTVRSVRPGHKNVPFIGFEGFSYARLVDNGDGTYKKLLREVGYYTDLATGEVLDTFTNPFTNEKVKVVHIANDPFNYVIGPYYPKPPTYGKLNVKEVPDIPMYLPFQDIGNGQLLLQSGIDLFYPSALQPDKWPRESPGKMNQVTEMFNYVLNKDDVADKSKTALYFSGTWNRITPWLPWMLMDQADGHCHYDCVMGCYADESALSPQVRAYAEKHHPTFFSAPDKWEEPSLSSLEHYALEQKPAPPKKG